MILFGGGNKLEPKEIIEQEIKRLQKLVEDRDQTMCIDEHCKVSEALLDLVRELDNLT